jgi:hypothetical protein
MSRRTGAAGQLPVVVLAFPRSGTTLVRRVLDAHPQVSCPPETNLLSACGRFLRESGGEGPPLGVLSGLAFSGIDEEEVLAGLRQMVVSIHWKLAGDKPVWMEKSGFDVFYLDEIERLMTGHCRFLCMVRNPLDVIVSVRDLVEKAGHYMPELREHLLRHDNPWDAFAAAWIDRAAALQAFVARHPEASLLVRYEDLVDDPLSTFGRITRFIGVPALSATDIDAALAAPGRIGLGDWKALERRSIDAASVSRWRSALPRAATGRLVTVLQPWLEAFGYAVPRVRREPDRGEALKQFEIVMRLQHSKGDAT